MSMATVKKMSMQRLGCPRRHALHFPHGGVQATMTWSPTLLLVTPSPTAMTSPAPSWPGMNGAGWGRVPFMPERSEWQIPAAWIRTLTCPGPGSSTVRLSTISTDSLPLVLQTAPRIVPPSGLAGVRARSRATRQAFDHAGGRGATRCSLRRRPGRGQEEADGHGELVVDPGHRRPAVDPAHQGRVPDVADDPGPCGRVRGVGLADGPGDDALHQDGDLLLAGHRPGVGRGERREDGSDELGLAGHRPQGPVQHVEDPLGRVLAPGRLLGQPGVEQLDPADQGGRQQVVL